MDKIFGSSLIEIAEREIRRDSEDLSRLKVRYPGYDFILIPKELEGAVPPAPEAQRTARTGLSSLESAILTALKSDLNREWTSRALVSSLGAHGYRLPEKDDAAMNAVSYALISLRESGNIVRVHEGKGRDPHRYSALRKDKEANSEEKTS